MTTRNVVGALAALLAIACADRPAPQPPPAVQVEVVATGAGATEGARYSAVVQPASQVVLAFRVPGYVSQLMKVRGADGRAREVAEGDRVRRGDVLARLRDTEYRDKVRQATAQAAAARAAAVKARLDGERAGRLMQTRSITRPELEGANAQRDATQAQLAAAEAALAEASVALRDTALVAPLDGDVVKKALEPGTLTGPGLPAFAVADVSRVKVVIGVPDVMLRSLALGRQVTVTSDALPGQRVDARVTRIASAADPVTRNFDVEVEIPNPGRTWRAGMIAAVVVASQAPRPDQTLLPFSAIVEAPGDRAGYAAMVVEGDGAATKAIARPIELGRVVGNRVEVVHGLSPGDRIVTTGASLLTSGERVEIVPSERR